MQDKKALQEKLLEIVEFVDEVCRENNIKYSLAYGSTLGAVRHKGFIPWDDHMDIFLTAEEYSKFRDAFLFSNNKKFFLQEWNIIPKCLEYAKIRMNGTTFIETNCKELKDIHQGIFIDIFILHKIPTNYKFSKIHYYINQYLTLYSLITNKNWKPKTKNQNLIAKIVKFMPNKLIAKAFYKKLNKFDKVEKDFYYYHWMMKGSYNKSLFPREMFDLVEDIEFENTKLMCCKDAHKYLTQTYGDYMILPSEEQRLEAIHAEIFDTEKDYTKYL